LAKQSLTPPSAPEKNPVAVQKDIARHAETKPVTKEKDYAEAGRTVHKTAVTTKETRYKVRSKAYFHNEPDESTRRNAFIIHWNNAILSPSEEKDGFIYLVFTNHLGQVSKGWLSKRDLIEVK
jgi:serine/threonine-protein kinase